MRQSERSAAELEQKRKRNLERIQQMTFMDDIFMTKTFEDAACAQVLLQVILEQEDLRVMQPQTQRHISNLQGRSARLDILAVDAAGKIYNVEVQQEDRGAVPKRARYYSSLLDANVTEPGDDLGKLVETYVIFITEHDVLGKGRPIYHIERTVLECDHALFGDEAHIIYVNSQIRDNTPLGRLMHDFHCKDPADMYYDALQKRAQDLKTTREGVEIMGRISEELIREGYDEGVLIGREKGKQEGVQLGLRRSRIENARTMLADGSLPLEMIARFSGLTIMDVRALAKNPEKDELPM